MNVFNKIIDHRIATTSGADAVARSSGSLVTVVFYSTWKRAVYVLGRRVAG